MSVIPLTADLLASLESITHETARMLALLDEDPGGADRRELKRRVLELRTKAQELIDWLSVERLETPPS